MADMTTIHGLLTDIAASTAFTPDALQRFQDALKRAKELEATVASQGQRMAELSQKNSSLVAELSTFNLMEKAIKEREAAVAKREAAITALETKVAVAEAKDGVRKEVFDTIFRLPTVRRSFTDNVATIGYAGGNSTNGNETHTVNETKTEE